MPDIEKVRRWSVSSDLIANLVEGRLETLFGDCAVQVAGKRTSVTNPDSLRTMTQKADCTASAARTLVTSRQWVADKIETAHPGIYRVNVDYFFLINHTPIAQLFDLLLCRTLSPKYSRHLCPVYRLYVLNLRRSDSTRSVRKAFV